MKPLPPQALLLELFTYDPSEGVLRRRKNGKVAGTKKPNSIQVFVNYGQYAAHRLIWKIITGYDPPALIDHENTDCWDNRWVNLRLADNGLNIGNSRIRKDNLSGFKGVHIRREKGRSIRYRAIIERHKKRYILGDFKTPEEAHSAYVVAAKLHFGPFANSG
jgi:HNH endonuclease